MTGRDAPLQKGESPLRICSLSKEEFQISKDAKFSPGIYLFYQFKLIGRSTEHFYQLNKYIQIFCTTKIYVFSLNINFQWINIFNIFYLWITEILIDSRWLTP